MAENFSFKSRLVTSLLCFHFGFLGAHRFYVGKKRTGIIQLLTLGGFGIWSTIDLLVILSGNFKDKNGFVIDEWMTDGKDIPSERQSNSNRLAAYFLCMLLGVFGIHRFYVRKNGTGILQLLTLGGLGFWALFDSYKIIRGEFTDKDGAVLAQWNNFVKPYWRTIWIALAGQGIFLVSVFTMTPLRMWENPVVNYNLIYVPILAAILGSLFYRCCIEEQEAKGYLYGFFAALFAWPLIGEVAAIPVDKGAITQFSDFNIKALGAYFYVISGWALLHIMWRTAALKKSVCVFFMTFLSIWSFELYMDNYSSMSGEKFVIIGGLLAAAILAQLLVCFGYAWKLFKVRKPIKAILGILLTIVLALVTLINYRDVLGYVDTLQKMAGMSTMVLIGSLIATYMILRAAKRTESLERKTILGCIFYIVFALILMSGQWKEPQTFYVKYEAAGLAGEIKELQHDQDKLERLSDYMITKRMLKASDFKYMYEHGILSQAKLKKLVNIGMVDGTGLEFLATRGLITVDEFQSVIDRNMLSEADLQPLRDMGIVKIENGKNILYRQYLKMVKKED